MLITKKIMTEQTEENCINAILEQVRKNNMTIGNLKEVTAKVINFLESNAVLEKEDSYVEAKANFKIDDMVHDSCDPNDIEDELSYAE